MTILSIIGVAFLTGILSGIYPAIVLSSFKPIKTLKGAVSGIQSKYSLRRILVVFQFTISIILIIGTAVVYLQMQYILNKDTGMDKNNIVYISLSEALQKNAESLKAELLKNPNIKNVTVSSGIPTDIYVNSGGWSWDGKNPQQEESVSSIGADDEFLKTYGIKLSAGRYYSRELAGNNSGTIVINESFAKLTGYNDPIGKTLTYGNQVYNIIGVVKDFNFISLQKKIGPLVIYSGSYPQYLSIKTVNSGLSETLDYIKTACTNFDPRFVFDYEFLDSAYKKAYTSELRLGKIFNAFTFLAILISCLGLLGLTSFVTELKTKEVAIRKTLGASTGNILFLLSGKFITWVIIANIFSWPAAYYFMNKWLEGFAYRIDLSLWIFVLAGGIALVIALTTVSFQAMKAAMANPVKCMKYE
jgi:putative ABC transport system permease protein